jgi:peptidyl-tRNA hydrolase
MPTKQVIVLRTRYPDGRGGQMGMRFGKSGAQIAHASEKVFFDRAVRGFEDVAVLMPGADTYTSLGKRVLVIPLTPEMEPWVFGTFTKVLVGVETEEELLRVHELAKEAGLPTALIQDMGATEFKGVPTYTTCGIGPAEAADIDRITGPEGLVKVKLL